MYQFNVKFRLDEDVKKSMEQVFDCICIVAVVLVKWYNFMRMIMGIGKDS